MREQHRRRLELLQLRDSSGGDTDRPRLLAG